MRNEKVYYYKLMLLCGYPEEVNQAISTALDHQNPIEPDILDLSACGNDAKKQLSVLNAILARDGENLLDHKVIFELVRRFLHQQYVTGMEIPTLVKLMYRIAKETGWYDEEPWNTLFLMEDYYDDAQWGVKNRDQFLHRFARLLNFGDTKVVRTRCASISDIVDIKENRIYYREKYGNDAYIDLDSCAAFCQLMYPKQTSGLRCVGERNICGIPFYEFYDREPIRFTLCVKNNLLQRIISRMAGWNFHANKYKAFCDIQKELNNMGFTTFDLS